MTTLHPEVIREADKAEMLFAWLIPRLAGNRDDKLTAITMINAYRNDAYNRGVHDSASAVQMMHDASVNPMHRPTLKIVADALFKLEKLNKSDGV